MRQMERNMRRLMTAAALAGLGLLGSCGGGGGSAGICAGSFEVCNPGANTLVLSPTQPSAAYAGTCNLDTERKFVRSYLDEVYLWTDEIPATDASLYTTAGYFYNLLVTTPDIHGLPKDRFSFIVTQADADSLSTGASVGYGVLWETDGAGRNRVAFVEAGSPAALAGLARGGELVAVIASTHQGWYPNAAGASITFSYRAAPGLAASVITLNAAPVQEEAVPLTSIVQSPGGRRVGYLLFNSHTRGAQDKLLTAVAALAAGGIQDLVLDLRYNSGGFLYVANTLASMVTGPSRDGQVFERLQFNHKLADASQANVYRYAGQVQFTESVYPAGTPLPRLALPRVYVLATGSTCSASESVINGLRGVDVEVILVGGTTCGKPYGFMRQDNCGLSLFPIEFQGFNAKDFGDYSTGFAPTCPGADDFTTALGNPAEGLLGIALRHADTGVCYASAAAPQSAAAGPAIRRPAQPGRLLLNRP